MNLVALRCQTSCWRNKKNNLDFINVEKFSTEVKYDEGEFKSINVGGFAVTALFADDVGCKVQWCHGPLLSLTGFTKA